MWEVIRGKESPAMNGLFGRVAGFHSLLIRRKFWKAKGEPVGERRSCCGPCSRSEVEGGRPESRNGQAALLAIVAWAGTAPTAVTSSVLIKPRRLNWLILRRLQCWRSGKNPARQGAPSRDP